MILLLQAGACNHKPTKAECRVDKGISAQASHRTVREPLDSYGSCYSNHCLKPNFHNANRFGLSF